MSRAVCTVAGLVLAAAGAGAEGVAAPSPCHAVRSGEDLVPRLEAAAPGSALCLAPGAWRGPLRIGAGVTLWGPRDAVLSGGDTTVALRGPGAALLGVTIEGSGNRFDRLDAAVLVAADHTRVEGVRIRGALFGIRAERANDVVLRNNEIEGDPARPFGLRGDGIRLWEVRGARIEGNQVRDGRDLVAWYAPGNRFVNNRVSGGRYGLHFMHSSDNDVERNEFADDVVGVFVMYSRHVRLLDNRLLRARGAAGIGLGVKQSGDLEVRGNLFLANSTGVFVDGTGVDPDQHNRFESNTFVSHERAIVFHGAAARNHFLANRFLDNRVDVAVEGRGDARAASFRGNAWDVYVGYDLDGDGVGDLPHEPTSLANEWIARIPALAFFRGSAALGLVEWLGRALPLFRPSPLLRDPAPRLALGTQVATRAN